jgi:dCMP deaminase
MISEKLKNAYMKTAYAFSECSTATRLKVGAILVDKSGKNIISFSYNGTPSGWSNVCEDENNQTLPEVLHAESNLIAKISKITLSSEDSTMFVTHSPCFQCAKLIYQAGVKQIFYSQEYRCRDGIEFLEKMGIKVTQLS